MRACVLQDSRISLQQNYPIDSNSNNALVKVLMSGICGTDLQLLSGYYPQSRELITGHEFVGVVVQAPPEWMNLRVVAHITIQECNCCRLCTKNLKGHCLNRKVLGIKEWNGAHAEFVSIPLQNLVKVPESIPDSCAVFAEPLAAALQILQQVHVRPTDQCLIMGCGRLGQLVARVLRLTGAEITCIVKRKQQELLLQGFGRMIRVEDVKDEELRDRFDVVVEATGSSDGMDNAIDYAIPRGIVVAKSTTSEKSTIHLSKAVVKEVKIVGSRCGSLEAALRLMEQGLVDPTPLISKIVPFSEIESAFELAAKKENIKILVDHRG
jgi:2-desacetyl-2-hydroxyethyl bacteriochlorophyllide A dehydrogenase